MKTKTMYVAGAWEDSAPGQPKPQFLIGDVFDRPEEATRWYRTRYPHMAPRTLTIMEVQIPVRIQTVSHEVEAHSGWCGGDMTNVVYLKHQILAGVKGKFVYETEEEV